MAYIEYKWGHVVPEYEGEEHTAKKYIDSFDELNEEMETFDNKLFDGHHLTEDDIVKMLEHDKEMIIRYLTETRWGKIDTHSAQRSEIWVEVIRDSREDNILFIIKRNKELEKQREGWDEWMDGVFPSFRNDD